MDKDEGIEVGGPGGWRANFKGTNGICVAVLLGIGALTWFLFGRSDARVEALIQAQAETKKEVRENTETQQVMIYVLTLPQPERERLNLMKPRKLSEMQGMGNWMQR
jgi:hypothetical protein